MVFFLLVATAVARVSLRSRAHTVPRLQTDQVFHDDFVHDDTLHPGEAVKLNIVESENRLKEAEAALEAYKAGYAAAGKKKEDAEEAHEVHAEAVTEAETMVAKYNDSIAFADQYKAGLAGAETKLVAVKDVANQTDIAATAAAETVKQAQEDLHESIMELVDAKENITDASRNVSEWEAKVADTVSANVSLAEWKQKLNETVEHDADLEAAKVDATASYDTVRGNWKKLEARFFDAQKMFDADQAEYEEHVGPYPPEKKEEENLWIDALTSGDWHADWLR